MNMQHSTLIQVIAICITNAASVYHRYRAVLWLSSFTGHVKSRRDKRDWTLVCRLVPLPKDSPSSLRADCVHWIPFHLFTIAHTPNTTPLSIHCTPLFITNASFFPPYPEVGCLTKDAFGSTTTYPTPSLFLLPSSPSPFFWLIVIWFPLTKDASGVSTPPPPPSCLPFSFWFLPTKDVSGVSTTPSLCLPPHLLASSDQRRVRSFHFSTPYPSLIPTHKLDSSD